MRGIRNRVLATLVVPFPQRVIAFPSTLISSIPFCRSRWSRAGRRGATRVRLTFARLPSGRLTYEYLRVVLLTLIMLHRAFLLKYATLYSHVLGAGLECDARLF